MDIFRSKRVARESIDSYTNRPGGVINIFKALLDTLDQGILLIDTEHRVVYANSWIEQNLGIHKEHRHKSLQQIQISPELLSILTSNETSKEHREYLNGKSILFKGHTFTDRNNNIVGILWCVCSCMEQTGESASGHETAEPELNAIIESVSDGIYVTDGKGITLRVNSAFQQITGIKAKEVVGKHVEDLIKMDVFRKSATIEVLAAQKQVSLVEDLKIGKEVLLTGTPVFNDKNEIFRVVTTLRDVKSLNDLRKQLAESEEKTKLYERELFQLRLQQMDMENIIIASRQMREIVQMAIRLGEVNSNVLIYGESGVGKDIVAKIIHKSCFGQNAPLITCNCGAIPESLIESELFGYEGGAFTGAKKEGNPGLFELARGGTLFLDEIGELPFGFQSKFLRAIQEREVTRVGGKKPIKLDFRLISATNRDLEEMVREKLFRSDLYYRLNVVPLYIPPLRERKDSITSFVYTFLDFYNKQFNRNVRISPEALEMLEDYDWPGNIRQLKNTIERLVVLTINDVITPADLPRDVKSLEPEESGSRVSVSEILPLQKAIEEIEFQLFSKTYKKYRSTRKTARILGISQSQASRKLNKYNLYEISDNHE